MTRAAHGPGLTKVMALVLPNMFAFANMSDVEPLVGPPPHFLPHHAGLLPPDEQVQRQHFWCSAMLLEMVAVCLLGTLVMGLKGDDYEKLKGDTTFRGSPRNP